MALKSSQTRVLVFTWLVLAELAYSIEFNEFDELDIPDESDSLVKYDDFAGRVSDGSRIAEDGRAADGEMIDDGSRLADEEEG